MEPWLSTLKQLEGTVEGEGEKDNPVIMSWREEIAKRYPDMAGYTREFAHDSIPWCGYVMAYTMAVNGFRPPQGFLWARNWLKFGTPTTPREGAVMVFKRGDGGHVALYDGEDEKYYFVWGGNQSNKVCRTRYPKSEFLGARWPAAQATSTISGVGPSTHVSTADVHSDVPVTLGVASVRYNNPGAQYPCADAARFGQVGYGRIGGGHKIARFPHPVNGVAANLSTLARLYVGMKFGEAGKKWTGAYGFGIPGYDDDTVLMRQMVDDPLTAIPIMKAIARREAGKESPLTEAEWQAGHEMFLLGSADAWLAKHRTTTIKPRTTAVNKVPTPIALPKQPSAWKLLFDALLGRDPTPLPVETGIRRPGLDPDGSAELYDVQKLLASKGYTMVGRADGLQGPNTDAAVMAFRHESGLVVSTEVDKDFMAALAAAGPREISAARVYTTANEMRASGSGTVQQFDLFKTLGGLFAVFGAAGGADASGLLDQVKDLAQKANDTAEVVTTLATSLIGAIKWSVTHWWVFALFGGLYITYRALVAVLTVVNLFRQGVLTRSDR